MPEARTRRFAALYFSVSLGLAVFVTGGVFGSNGWQPYQMFEDGYDALRQLWHEFRETRSPLSLPIKYKGDGVTRNNAAQVFQGLTLMQGLFSDGVGLRLVDMNGTVVRHWPADFFKVWPNPSHVIPNKNVPLNHFHYHPQGMWAFPDGSVVFNFAELGAVKLDKCGTEQWKIDRMTHHSVTPNPDGSVWMPVKGDVREVPPALFLPGMDRNRLLEGRGWYEDRLLLVDRDGKIVREISVLKALFEGKFEYALAGIRNNTDPTHVNDIEVVTPALALKIAGVEVGDLLISIRNLNMLAILDQISGEIKWVHSGPWVGQHDPDITDQGTIEVFNNEGNYLKKLGPLPSSNIVSLDPASGEARTVYPPPGEQSFYSDVMGTHQLLPNGNRLITESRAGRVFEVDAQGVIVWEYVKPYDKSHASVIDAAIRYGDSYFTVKDWHCP